MRRETFVLVAVPTVSNEDNRCSTQPLFGWKSYETIRDSDVKASNNSMWNFQIVMRFCIYFMLFFGQFISAFL